MSVRIEGRGLHTGKPAAVVLTRVEEASPIVVRQGEVSARLEDLVPVPGERCTTVASRDGALRVATVEHLLAAMGGLGVHSGLEIAIEGPELPLLDGGASAFVLALERIGARRTLVPRLVVAREGRVEVLGARYAFRPAEAVRVEVTVDFELSYLAPAAAWGGSAEDFATRIAPARTFGLAHEVLALVERGLASHVAPESAVVLGPDGALASGAPFAPDEPARHKLLDLVGDLALHGGPPLGVVVADRPGHTATHEAVARALAQGILARRA